MIDTSRLRPSRTDIRAIFLMLIIASAGLITYSYAADPATGTANTYVKQSQLPIEERAELVGDRDNLTVIAGMDSPFKATKALYAFNADGKLTHYSNNTVYGDVDPTGDPERVLVAGHDYFRKDNPGCEAKCTWQNITYVNLTTGEHNRIYSYNTPGYRNSNWHDVDHLGGDRYLIAGMRDDNIWIINTTSGIREWQWDAQSEYPIDEAGPYPRDWAHLNDVEKLDDGRIMASLRNQDQVVFIDPEHGLIEDWTLGCEDCHSVLFEQHNPDYIPAENGGPAVLVSDSENNRIVEYQRVNGSWELSWYYQDSEMSWPRDADRLPNGHTLITDSHGGRVFEINKEGEIVWEARIINGYDAERLGTGDESTGGPSAVEANLTSVGPNEIAGADQRELANEGEWDELKLMEKYWHAMQFVFPVWVTKYDVIFAAFIGLVSTTWLGTELYWRGWRLRRPLAKLRREEGGVSHGDD